MDQVPRFEQAPSGGKKSTSSGASGLSLLSG